jgi:Mlc titration factor MtfA (ptsG expression regulator)
LQSTGIDPIILLLGNLNSAEMICESDVMLWSWWRNRQRKKLLSTPFPPAWESLLSTHCRYFARLTNDERQRLRNDVRLLVVEKRWEGCNGLAITEEIQVTIAAHAALMGLGFPELPFDRLLSILVYPDTFVARRNTQMSGGGWLESNEPRLGEAWYQGPVILVWREIREQCLDSPTGRNVIIHEFAHLLDMQDREVNGVPTLPDEQSYETWLEVTEKEFDRLQRQIRLGRRTLIDRYGATSRAEFFAVSSETFFEQPVRMQAELPRLYDVMKAYYGQDPAARALSNGR